MMKRQKTCSDGTIRPLNVEAQKGCRRRDQRWCPAVVALVVAALVVFAPLSVSADEEDYRAYFTGELGASFMLAPLYQQTPVDGTCDDHCMATTSAMGLGPGGEFRLAPVFIDYFGLDVGVRGHMGMMTDMDDYRSHIMEAHGSARAYLGVPQVRLYGGYEYGHRILGASSDSGMRVGTDSYRVHGPQAGVDFCLDGYANSPRYCWTNLIFQVDLKRPEFDVPVAGDTDLVMGDRATVFTLRLGFATGFITGSYAHEYPVANPPGLWENEEFGTSGVTTSEARMMMISFGFSGDIMNDGGGALLEGLDFIGMLLGMDPASSSAGSSSSSSSPSVTPAREGRSTTGGSSTDDDYICTNTCQYAYDGDCDDGGPGADFDLCEYGTDCADCGPRPPR